MTNIELVIKIPESQYRTLHAKTQADIVDVIDDKLLIDAIKDGVPLPKGCDIQRIIPKRVDVQKWICVECPNPNCNYELSTHHGDGYYSIEHKPDFCPNCGQALLWESEE